MSSASGRGLLVALTLHARHVSGCIKTLRMWQLPHFDLHIQHLGNSAKTILQQVLRLPGGDEGVMQHIAACMGPLSAHCSLPELQAIWSILSAATPSV